MNRLIRSWLFVPGDNEKMLGKCTGLGADAIVLDLEDAVIESRKAMARELISDHLQSTTRQDSQLWVRINAFETEQTLTDLEAVMSGRPDGVVLPKAESAADATRLAESLAELEVEHGIEPGSTGIMMVAVETARGLLGISSYTAVHPRVVGLTWGAVDLSASIGALSNVDEQGLFTGPYQLARDLTLVAAAAAGVQAIDTAYLDFRNADGLQQDCRIARRDGFLGKMAIHPAQVGPINEAFMPSSQEVEAAQAVLQAFAANPTAGTVSLNGKMLDKPHLLQAQRTLSLVEQYGD